MSGSRQRSTTITPPSAMAMGLVKGEGLGLQQGIHELKSAMPPARFNQEMHAHALACSRDQLMMPPLAAQLCSAQISESRAEASALMARQPRLETRDAPAASCAPRTEHTRRQRACTSPPPPRHQASTSPHPPSPHPDPRRRAQVATTAHPRRRGRCVYKVGARAARAACSCAGRKGRASAAGGQP